MKKDNKNIVVYLPQIYSEFMAELRKEIERMAKEKECRLIFLTCFGNNNSIDEKRIVNRKYDEGERVIFRLGDAKKIDGIMLLYDTFAMSQWREIFDMVKGCKCPVINFRSPLKMPGVYDIYVDDDQSFADMIQHFINEHHMTKINLVTGPVGNVHSEIRLDIYRKVLEKNGIPYEESRVYRGNFWKNCGEEIVEQMLDDENITEAIVCANDYMAISVMEALKKRHIMVPRDILVSGYDNVEESQYCYPSLTTVGQPVEEMVQKAFEVLEQVWMGGQPQQEVYIPGKLVLRQSCGCDCRMKDFSVDYSMILGDRLDKMSYLEISSTTMVTSMSNATNLEECLKSLKEYALKDTGFKSFALCLAQHWEKQLPLPVPGYGASDEIINMVVGIHEGKEISKESFPVSQLLPKFYLKQDDPCYIIPIHYLQYYMGYAVVQLEFDVPNMSSIKTWFWHLDNALENIRMKGHLKRLVNELEDLYVRDTLTGLFNRHGLEKYSSEYYQQCLQNQSNLMIMEIDMDGLKQINDIYGHHEGDYCITMIANAMIYAAKNGEICIRSGGDEYVVIGKEYSQEKLDYFTNAFYGFIENANNTMKKPYQFGASMGYYMAVPDGRLNAEGYLKNADTHMYANKKLRKASSHPGVDVR